MELFSKKSNLDMNVFFCQKCNYYVTGDSEKEVKDKLKDLYSGQYWDERKARESIESDYTDSDSLGKRRNWISQYAYCKQFFKNKKSILEIGVGRGQAAFWFEREGYEVSGIEPDAQNVNLIDKKLKKGKIIHSFIEKINLEEKFDIIWMSHVLEHLIRPDVFLEKIKKNLKNDGIFFIEVPSCEHKPTLDISIFENPHIHHFSRKSLTKLVEREYTILVSDCFRPATKLEGAKQKIFHSFEYYPRIKTTCKEGRDLRMILSKKE